MKNKFLNSLFIVLFVASIVSCTNKKELPQTSIDKGVTELKKGIMPGYLTKEEYPNSIELLPKPPKDSSLEFQLDQEKASGFVAIKDEARKKQAVQDANLSFPDALKAYNGILAVKITPETTPVAYMLMRRVLTDAGLSTYKAKNYYQRERPFMVNNNHTLTPDDEEALRKDGSYPSGHTAIGWAWALVLTEIYPAQADEILKRGEDFGTSRNVCNAHWFSDVNAGRTMGAVIVARLHANKQFLVDMEAAKKEIDALSK